MVDDHSRRSHGSRICLQPSVYFSRIRLIRTSYGRDQYIHNTLQGLLNRLVWANQRRNGLLTATNASERRIPGDKPAVSELPSCGTSGIPMLHRPSTEVARQLKSRQRTTLASTAAIHLSDFQFLDHQSNGEYATTSAVRRSRNPQPLQGRHHPRRARFAVRCGSRWYVRAEARVIPQHQSEWKVPSAEGPQ